MLAHGFSTAMLVSIVQHGLATEAIGTVRVGCRMIEVRRLHITEAGRKAIEEVLRRTD